jgi:hypothetical protein
MARTFVVSLLITMFTLSVGGCGTPDDASVRVTLADGQVLYGPLKTAALSLEGGIGTLEIPLSDIGEVVPVEGGQLEDSDGYVHVWLRNGSELAGRWQDPELAMGIAVGGEDVKIELPTGDLQRLQTHGGEVWPDQAVYRVQTTHGDDFLVDAEASRLVLTNDLGTFSPYLSECRSARPVADAAGEWIVELETGTVLRGDLVDDELTLALPMGPGEVVVPLAVLTSMEQQDWSMRKVEPVAAAAFDEVDEDGAFDDRTARRGSGRSWQPWADRERSEDAPAAEQVAAPSVAPRDAGAGGWFERGALEETKDAQ